MSDPLATLAPNPDPRAMITSAYVEMAASVDAGVRQLSAVVPLVTAVPLNQPLPPATRDLLRRYDELVEAMVGLLARKDRVEQPYLTVVHHLLSQCVDRGAPVPASVAVVLATLADLTRASQGVTLDIQELHSQLVAADTGLSSSIPL